MQQTSEASFPDRPSMIRWYVNLIENLALSWHWGNEEQFEDIERIFQHTVALLYDGSKRPNGCPWPRCPNGLCSPICVYSFRDESHEQDFLDENLRCPGEYLESGE